ncbi:hypothetical protein [Pontibacter sp. G13]|uniref:hypothetical protein n=1 Tax=Pontibacter sp. G13 TaxID=3074898 RepID=UPI00288C021F|nr:hypothetical protein [Pontibacter sp. G13]WNJ18048.1 hypothetical protein RJD25_24595 [Pontibacter sp. G13]
MSLLLNPHTIERILHTALISTLPDQGLVSLFKADDWKREPLGEEGPFSQEWIAASAQRVSQLFGLGEVGGILPLVDMEDFSAWLKLLGETTGHHVETLRFPVVMNDGSSRLYGLRGAFLRHQLQGLWERMPAPSRVFHFRQGFDYLKCLTVSLVASVSNAQTMLLDDLPLHRLTRMVLPTDWAVLPRSIFWKNSQRWHELAEQIHLVVLSGPEESPMMTEWHHSLPPHTELYGDNRMGLVGIRQPYKEGYRIPAHVTRGQGDKDFQHLPETGGLPWEVDSPDALKWDRPDTFRVVGTKESLITVHGHEVYPAQLAQKLLKHPEIRACLIHAGGGLDQTALIFHLVPEEVESDVPAEWMRAIRMWTGRNLAPHERPAEIHVHLAPTDEPGWHVWDIDWQE